MQKKVNVLIRFLEAICKRNKKQHHIQNQSKFLPWYLKNGIEYFDTFEYLVRTSHEIKKVGEILAKPAPKKGKAITTETLHLVTNVFEGDNFSR